MKNSVQGRKRQKKVKKRACKRKRKKKKEKERKKEEDESMQGRKRVWECNKIQFFALAFLLQRTVIDDCTL